MSKDSNRSSNNNSNKHRFKRLNKFNLHNKLRINKMEIL